jgi:hypothetical protein
MRTFEQFQQLPVEERIELLRERGSPYRSYLGRESTRPASREVGTECECTLIDSGECNPT